MNYNRFTPKNVTFFELGNQKKTINQKRKISEIIIQDIDSEFETPMGSVSKQPKEQNTTNPNIDQFVFEGPKQPRQPLRLSSSNLANTEYVSFDRVKKSVAVTSLFLEDCLNDEIEEESLTRPSSAQLQLNIEEIDEPHQAKKTSPPKQNRILFSHKSAVTHMFNPIGQKKTKSYDIDALDLDSSNTTKDSISSVNSDFPIEVDRSVSRSESHSCKDPWKQANKNHFLTHQDIDETVEEKSHMLEQPSTVVKYKKNRTKSLNIIDELLKCDEESVNSIPENRIQVLDSIRNHNLAQESNPEIVEYSEEKSTSGFKFSIHKVIGRRSGGTSKNLTHYDLDDVLSEETGTEPPLKTGRKRLQIESLFESSQEQTHEPEEILSLSTNSLSLDEPVDQKTAAADSVNFEPSTHNWITNYGNTPTKQLQTKQHKTEVATGSRTGSDWLREVNERQEKLNQTANLNQTTCLNETSLNETLLVTTGGRKTSPTLLTVNTSSLFLNDGDIRKRKIKYIKNGLAEKLQKLLVRQTSNMNFIKHHMNKQRNTANHTQSINMTNMIQVVPFHRQTAYNGTFFLIYALDVTTNDNNQQDAYVKLLIDPRHVDVKVLNISEMGHFVLKIYPPWKKIQIRDTGHSVYFNVNLIEVEDNKTHMPQIRCMTLADLTDLTCSSCLGNGQSAANCTDNLFNVAHFVHMVRLAYATSSQGGKQSQLISSSDQNLLFTQTQQTQFTKSAITANNANPLPITNTQYMNDNSILHALANVGYSGFVSFRATVQRVGLMKWTFNAYTALNSQRGTQAQSQFNQNCQYKHQIIVSDKCGIFALVIFPFSVDFTGVIEAQKYSFGSLKLVEKQSLCDTPLLDDQISVMWEEMKVRRQAGSKTPINSAYQRVIFVFEFMTGGRSLIEPLGPSNSHLPAPSFNSIRELGGLVQQNSIHKMLFNLNDIIPLKLIELPDGLMSQETGIQNVLFFVDKQSFARQNEPVYSIGLQTLSQFNDSGLLETLTENRIPIQLASGQVCLRNLFLFNSATGDFKLDSNLFSSIDTLAARVSENNEDDIAMLIGNVFPTLENDSTVKPYDFVNLSGRVTYVCEEGFSYHYTCLLCNYQQFNRDYVQCEKCQRENVKLNAQVQVVLNCVGVCRQVKLRLHGQTLQNMIKLHRDRLESVYDYFSMKLVGRYISTMLGFVESVSDTEIYAQELVLVE